MAVADLPTYGYRRVWALLRRESERDGLPVVNAKRVYRIMRTHNLLLERKPADPCRKRAHKGRVAVAESNRRWCSDGFEFRCDNGEKLRVTFAQDCCDREIIDWAASTGGYDKETVQDVMLGANSAGVRPVAGTGALYDSSAKPGKQWHSRKLRDDDKTGLHQHQDFRGLTLSGTKTHVKQRFLPLTPLLMVSDVLWSPVLPA